MKIVTADIAQVISRVKSWYDSERFVPWHLREVLLGLVINFGTIELSAYRLLKQDVNAGELPPYILDLMILVMGGLEVVIAPLVSWWGSQQRRITLTMWLAVATVCCFFWFAIPNTSEEIESEYCRPEVPQNSTELKTTSSSEVGARVGLVAVSCAVFLACRLGVWCHGLAYLEEYVPDVMPFYFGVVLASRVLTLLVDPDLLTSAMDSSLSLQTTYILLGMVCYLVPLPFLIPKNAPVVNGVQTVSPPNNDRGFLSSISRVCANRAAGSQMVAMGLLAASLWGAAYHDTDLVKVKYNLLPRGNESMMYSELLQYSLAVFVIAYYGDQFSSPILKQFIASKVVRQTIIMSVLAVILYVILAVYPTCDRGHVVELANDYFVLPQCSLKCGGGAGARFSPACAPQQQATYLAPRHAGCAAADHLHGLKMYTNCTCSSARLLPGACTKEQCTFAFYLYRTLFIALATVVLLGLQAQGALLLRLTDARDKSLTLGLASSVVAFVTFICGHVLFAVIQGMTCRWYGENKCHLQNDWFPTIVAATSGVLAFLSALFCVGTFICLRSENKKKVPDEPTVQNDIEQ